MADRPARINPPTEHAPPPVPERVIASRARVMSHHCHWPGCSREVPPKLWGCKQHWFALPATLRARIWRTYVPGQEITKTPSLEYIHAAKSDLKRISMQFLGRAVMSNRPTDAVALPEPALLVECAQNFVSGFTAEQMIAYGDARERAGYERAIRLITEVHTDYVNAAWVEQAQTVDYCIRFLKDSAT